jgi:hypothetical protein
MATQEFWQREVDGQIERKRRNAIKVIWTDENGKEWQTFNPKDELLIAAGWTKYVQPTPTDEELLKRAKQRKKLEIQRYDKSSEVNEFFVSGVSLWLEKNDRSGLILRFESELADGETYTTLWGNGMQFPLPLVDENGNKGVAFKMLYSLERYASACYDNTQSHLSAVDKLETIEEVESYDFKVGYPEKLNF